MVFNRAHHFCISIIDRALIYRMFGTQVFHVEIYQRACKDTKVKKNENQNININSVFVFHTENAWFTLPGFVSSFRSITMRRVTKTLALNISR